MRNCEKCKFIKEKWNNDPLVIWGKIRTISCGRGNDTEQESECKDFVEYEPNPYIERNNECDFCEFVFECEREGYLLEATNMDGRRHFIKGRGNWCRKRDGDLYEKNISEVISCSKKVNCLGEALIPPLEKVLEKYGDVKLKEVFERYLWEEFVK